MLSIHVFSALAPPPKKKPWVCKWLQYSPEFTVDFDIKTDTHKQAKHLIIQDALKCKF